jgi:cytidylate kinase
VADTASRRPPVRIITISRQFGSGGSDLAARLGDLLGWRVVDRQVIQEVAERLNVPEDEVDAVDEQVAGLIDRVGRYLADAFPEMLLPPPPLPIADARTVAVTAEAVLREAVAQGPAVLVGYAGQCIFADRPDALHLRVVAPLEHRVREIARRLEMSPVDARRMALEKDRDRHAYLHRFYGCEIEEPTLYGMQVNTGRIGTALLAELIAPLVRGADGS